MALAVTIFIALLVTNKVFNTEISVFVQTEDSIHLQIHEVMYDQFDVFIWKFENLTNIIRYQPSKKYKTHDSYKNRVDFSTENLSLTLKNIQKNDSGTYRAVAVQEKNKVIGIYKISVMDAVDAAVLTADYIWSSSNSCSVNFTCRGHNLTISSTYNNDSCSPKEVTSSFSTLILHCTENSIMCNYSNPVSWKTETQEIKQLCSQHDTENHRAHTWYVYLCSLGAVLILGLLCFFIHNKSKGPEQGDHTIYAKIEESNEIQKPMEMLKRSKNLQTVYDTASKRNQSASTMNTNQSTASPDSRNQQAGAQTCDKIGRNKPSTTYCLVGQHQKPSLVSETDHTIYAMINKT